MHRPSESATEAFISEMKLLTVRVMPSSVRLKLVSPSRDWSKVNVVAACVFDGASATVSAMPRAAKRVRVYMQKKILQ